MSSGVEQANVIGSERRMQRDRTNGALRHASVPLPAELWQVILQSDVLSRNDVLQVRTVSRQMKEAVDNATLPKFRVPTTYLTGEKYKSRSTVLAFLQAKEESHARKMARHSSRRIVSTGASSVLIHDQARNLLIRCGNGRLVQADLDSSSCVFSEVGKSGAISGGEKLRAARYRPAEQDKWRVVTQSARNNDLFLYSFQEGNRWRKLLPRPFLTTTTQDFSGGSCSVVFSGCGQYVVERYYGSIARYRLDVESSAIQVEATLQNVERSTTLCAQTGRRLQASGVHQMKVSVYGDSISERFEKRFSLQRLPKARNVRLRELSVAPDGDRFAVCYNDEQKRSSLNMRAGDWLVYDTYKIKDNPFGSLLPIFSQKLPLNFDTRRYSQPSWQNTPDGGWVFQRRELVNTASYDRLFRWREGLESSEKMTAVLLPTTWRPESLHFVSSLAMGGKKSEKPTITRRQKVFVNVDHLVFRLQPKENTGGDYLFAMESVLLFAGAFALREESISFRWVAMLTASFASAVAAALHMHRDWLSQRTATRDLEPERVIAEDLQTTYLAPSP